MLRQLFNDGWTVSPKLSAFVSIEGGGMSGTPVTLPHDGVRDLDRDPDTANGSNTGFYPGAHLRYDKTFAVPSEWRDRAVSLEFEGVYRGATIYVNNDYVAQRPYGYSAFSVPLEGHLIYGADNTIRVEARSHLDSRWYSGAGIHRDVWLSVADPLHIALNGVRVTTPEIDSDLAVVVSEVPVTNQTRHTRTIRVACEIRSPMAVSVTGATPLTLRPGETGVAHLKMFVRTPRLWNVDSPDLYALHTLLLDGDRVIDEDETVFGIRSLRLDPVRGLQINGTTVKLRGGCVHHDNGPLGSAAIPRAEERRVEVLKAAGYNAVRSTHNPLSRSFIEACDRLGMLVIDELTDVWTEGKSSFDYSESFPEWWERDVESMVKKDFNHPSVIMYSIGNEIFEVGRPLGSTWGRDLAQKVRSLDTTRFVTNAINGLVAALDLVGAEQPRTDPGTPTDVNSLISSMGDLMNQFGASDEVSSRTEEAHGQLDASGINYSEARYPLDAHLYPNRVEYGSETFPGALDRLWALVELHPHVIGDFAWTAWDYLGEAGVGRFVYSDDPIQPTGIVSPYPWLAADCGTIDITGFRKPISYWREIVWGLGEAPYIAVHRPQFHGRDITVGSWAWDDVVSSWSWNITAGSPVRVDVYSSGDEVELLLDGVAVGRSVVGIGKPFIAAFDIAYQPGELTAVEYCSGRESARTSLRSASEELVPVLTADRNEIRSDSRDISFIEVTLRDEAGTLASDTTAAAEITIMGPGVLIGFANAQPDSEERFDATIRTLWNGRALAVVRATHAGDITVTASIPGRPSTSITIRAVG